MSTPAIALYLGETYATLGLFDMADTSAQRSKPTLKFEKSVFLPQTGLKNLLNQTKIKLEEEFKTAFETVPVYVVTKYFDRLKQFRLGGSISQVISKGFENSYSLKDSKSLSLAASQLIITLDKKSTDTTFLTQELERVKKINPDLNKVVISLTEDEYSATQIEELVQFFTKAGLKIFLCRQAHNQNELRKTLLNAGSEGTKEELIKDFTDVFGENTPVYFFCQNGFQREFENAELFNSANNFFAHYLKKQKMQSCAYFDIENFKFLRSSLSDSWQSPWGPVPLNHYSQTDLSVHPFAELKLNHLSMLGFDSSVNQLEPGPVIAGRAIKPLVLDLFWEELQKTEFCQTLFSSLQQDTLKSKITNILSVLEKGQKNIELFTSSDELKKIILVSLLNEIKLFSSDESVRMIGPLAPLFKGLIPDKYISGFSWSQEIMASAAGGKA
ncbi:MAG: hypothetical protein ACXVAX_02010 [Pseudobdellovibrio sp.]